MLPTLEKVSVEQRFSADDREVIALAEILVKSDVAVVEDWEKCGRDVTKYLLLTLQRWIRDHGGHAIRRRFDLDLVLSDRLVDYSAERGPEGTLYMIVDPDSAAFALLNPTIELLGNEHPRLPATFFRHFVGSLHRWVRVCDTKVVDSIDLKLGVYDRHRIAPHFCGTRLMPIGANGISHKVLQSFSFHASGYYFAFHKRTKGSGVNEFTTEFHAPNHGFQIIRVN